MAKKSGNPNWGKLGASKTAPSSEFERVTRGFDLQPEQYVCSPELREWAKHNKDSRYVPEALLKAWGFKSEVTL
jgi:hypothetical protein